jgi:phosphoribosylamine--glycine ligase
MGAYSPAPVVTEEVHQKAMEQVVQRAVDGMAAEGCPYQGIVYAGLMVKDGEVKTLEFNARFGDPECQPLLMRMKSDLVPLLLAVAEGDLSKHAIEWHDQAAICVVLAAEGYPGDYPKGDEITGIEAAEAVGEVTVFHAGTAEQDGHIVTSGGRVLGVTALGSSVADAIERAYQGVSRISWRGMQFRKDIGQKAIGRC